MWTIIVVPYKRRLLRHYELPYKRKGDKKKVGFFNGIKRDEFMNKMRKLKSRLENLLIGKGKRNFSFLYTMKIKPLTKMKGKILNN